VEPEEVNEGHKGPHILRSEVEKAIKEMRDKKATGDDVPVEALKLLGDDGLNLLTKLINNTQVVPYIMPPFFIENYSRYRKHNNIVK
jgi:hypothetical protein